MSRNSARFVYVFACAIQAACSSSSPGTPGDDAGGSATDAAQDLTDASSPEASSPDASQQAVPADASTATDGGTGSPCNLSANSVLINPTFTLTSGTSTTDCPSASNQNIQSSGCSLQPTGACTATATCTLQVNNEDGTGGAVMETGTLTVTGSTATGSVTYDDSMGFMCNNTVSGQVSVSMGTPGACTQTCANGALNNEMGCDPCLMKACATQYAACLADTESGGCINCSQLLSGTAGSGIECASTSQIESDLVACACSPATCD